MYEYTFVTDDRLVQKKKDHDNCDTIYIFTTMTDPRIFDRMGKNSQRKFYQHACPKMETAIELQNTIHMALRQQKSRHSL